MTQEEKAKAYDKAIEKIKYVMEHGVSPDGLRQYLCCLQYSLNNYQA